METFLKDLALGLRSLRKSPGFTIIAVTTLAIGIGANTAIFSLADLIIRRPVSLPAMEHLVVVDQQSADSENQGISPANYLDIKEGSKSFEQLAAYEYWSASEGSGEHAEEIHGVRVTPNFFDSVGVKPLTGRPLDRAAADSGRSSEIVVSNAFAKRRFGADASAVGQKIVLNGESLTVVGVMPARATFPLGAPAFWMPLVMNPRMRTDRTQLSLHTVGRLNDGVSTEQARGQIELLWTQLANLYPEANRNQSLRVVSLRDHIVLDYNRQFALLLMGAVGFVLLIACANIAILQLARGTRRRQEVAIRSALGAGRLRLFRQFLSESMLLAFVGASLGVLVATYAVALLRYTLPEDVRWFCDIESLDLSLAGFIFTAAVGVVVGLVSGVVPAWQHSGIEVSSTLAEGADRIVGQGSKFWRAVFVVSEMALAMTLLAGATLMVKGFSRLATGQAGLDPSTLLTFHLNLPESRYSDSQRLLEAQNELLRRLSMLPGVQAAAVASGIPYSFYEDSTDLILRADQAGPTQSHVVMSESVSVDYFRSVHIRLLDGREFDLRDNQNGLPVCIVSQSMAQRLWPGESAVGKQLKTKSANDGEWITVVGIASDMQHEIYDRSFRSILYRPNQQAPVRSLDFAIRTGNNTAQLMPIVRSVLREFAPDIPPENFESASDLIRSQASSLQYVAGLMAGFGAIALLLAALGVYAVMADSVTVRWREIAIRMALGAHSRKLLWAVMGRALSFAAIGIAIGLGMALGLAKVLSNLIYGVNVWDTSTFVLTPALLVVVALVACYLPTRRAVRTDTLAMLRHQ